MLELSKSDRAKFAYLGAQNHFVRAVRLQAPISAIAKSCGCSERTIRAWQSEKFLMTYAAVGILSKTYGVTFPVVTKITRREQNAAAGILGGTATVKKYGRVPVDETLRKQAWQQWWVDQGKSKSVITKPKEIHYPKKSVDLAEFVGIVLGDGGMTRGQLLITLNSKDDLEYSQFVIHLCKKLFGVNPSVYIRNDQNALVIMISRVALIRFLTEKLGLVVGNKVKHQVTIPDWIMVKKVYQIACLRGLVDTDGSVFTHRYTVKGKQYTYKKLSYTSASTPLKYGARNIFKTLGMQPRLAGAYDVRLDSKADMKTYFTVVSSHNPKHLKRLKN